MLITRATEVSRLQQKRSKFVTFIPRELIHKILERLQRLPGFDNEQVIAAMSSAALNAFLCWEADGQVRADSALLGFARFRRAQA
jgi:hypothetical protein